jgi:hypothetical protein
MSAPDETGVDPHRVAERSDLLPEEAAVGSDDPKTQAEIVLEDSDARTEQPERTKAESAQTPDRND